jgi:hypothetical protein
MRLVALALAALLLQPGSGRIDKNGWIDFDN